ncbi:MAG: PDZ domain-containing protein, partial [Myxococcota bacterium]|nr:PDZ domain-containing protein [Myxococcota bacterium]
ALTPDQRRDARLKRNEGLRVLQVDRGSAAHMAGIERGDIVIQANDASISGDIKAFADTVEKTGRGDMLSLLILRGSRQIYLSFTL